MADQTPDRCSEAVAPTGGSVCIHTNKIVDSCLDKDCIEDLRVYLTQEAQTALDHSTGAKARCAQLLHVYIDVEPVSFHKGHYSIDLSYYYRILGEITCSGARPTPLCGLAVFNKRVVLYGGESGARIFSSRDTCQPDFSGDGCPEVPEAIVESLDPIILAARVSEVCDCRRCETQLADIPDGICQCFDGKLMLSGETRRLYVTLGQFSTVRLERDAQLGVVSRDCCIPDRQCCTDAGCEEDPCELFSQIDFPYDVFYPRGVCKTGGADNCSE